MLQSIVVTVLGFIATLTFASGIEVAGTHTLVTPDNFATHGLCLSVETFSGGGEVSLVISAPRRSEGERFSGVYVGDQSFGTSMSVEFLPQLIHGRYTVSLFGTPDRLRHSDITFSYGPAGDRHRTYNIELNSYFAADGTIQAIGSCS